MRLRRISVFFLLCISAYAQPSPPWRLTRSENFELYSQGDDANARSALVWFEQLRAFYLQKTGLSAESLPPVRVIGFRSAREYQPYRLRPASDAHYIGTENRDYIVLATVDASQFGTAAHEYAHSIIRAAGLRFPPWFAEGLAEFFSTVHIGERGCTLGGDLPARSQFLQRHAWMPLADLVALPADSPARDNRDTAGLLYAQSWALAGMLVSAQDYAPRFRALIDALSTGTPSSQALAEVYGKSLDMITRDVKAWMAIRHPPSPLPGILPGIQAGQLTLQSSQEVSPLRARSLMAELVLASGDLDRAEAIYRGLALESPQDPEMFAALGTIALRQGNHERAREQWKIAIGLGIADAKLCYQYASLGEMAGIPEDELRPALQRAIRLQPDFEDARYHLALVEKNTGHYEAALSQLLAMRKVAPSRAYNYWIAMSDCLIQLDRREEAENSAQRAMQYATSASQRAYAGQLGYIAKTDLTVQFAIGESGRSELVTTRMPHKTADWNPFIEPGDKMRHAEGALREIECSGAITRFLVDTSTGALSLIINDPGHVQMRNAPSEFTCGLQEPAKVAVDYAVSKTPGAKVDGVVRGMEFK